MPDSVILKHDYEKELFKGFTGVDKSSKTVRRNNISFFPFASKDTNLILRNQTQRLLLKDP